MPTLTTVAEVKSQPGKEVEVKQLLAAQLQPTRKEKGCISFDRYVSHDDNSLFVLIAVWESDEAWKTHTDSPGVRALREELKPSALVSWWITGNPTRSTSSRERTEPTNAAV